MSFKRNTTISNALSFDIEEWYQTIFFYDQYKNQVRETCLRENVIEILFLLSQYRTKATFFIVASTAEKYPELVSRIAQDGHEIASHGYLHKSVFTLSRQQFEVDVEKSIKVLREITKAKVLGYRAPTWSITKSTPWAIEVLQSLGLKYDSSIYRLGLRFSSCRKHFYPIKGSFIEFPPSTFNCLGCHLPFSGGVFLRLFPRSFLKSRISELNKFNKAALVYFHPWEFDNQLPTTNLSKFKIRVQYFKTATVREKFKLLLDTFSFSPIKDVLGITESL